MPRGCSIGLLANMTLRRQHQHLSRGLHLLPINWSSLRQHRPVRGPGRSTRRHHSTQHRHIQQQVRRIRQDLDRCCTGNSSQRRRRRTGVPSQRDHKRLHSRELSASLLHDAMQLVLWLHRAVRYLEVPDQRSFNQHDGRVVADRRGS